MDTPEIEKLLIKIYGAVTSLETSVKGLQCAENSKRIEEARTVALQAHSKIKKLKIWVQWIIIGALFTLLVTLIKAT